MRTSLGLVLAALSFPLAASAQQAPAPTGPTEVIRSNNQLVVVDVVVQDKAGNPIHGLKPEDFHLSESKTPQTLRHVEEHTANTTVVAGPRLPPMPPGTFTDYTPTPPSGTLNILLIDALNTATKDQSYVQQQLKEYVNKAPAGTRIAIFGLANRLILLQGFSSDPAILKAAVDKKLLPRSSSLLDDPGGSGQDSTQPSDMIDVAGADPQAAAGLALEVANLQQFQAESTALETQLRVQYTLDAFNTLGHYLATFPGRKNLIWFSGSFPINILPDPSLNNSFLTLNVNQNEFRETTNLLSKAQVAVYPIDARGIVTPPMYNAASSGRAYNPRNSTPGGGAFANANAKFSASQATEHATMDELAEDTGGKASYNTNGIAEAVAKAVTAGANYYTLSYTPTDRRQDGRYRNIHVDVTGAPTSNLQLAYRHGYFADDADHKNAESAVTTAVESAPDPAAASHAAYSRAAMSRGAPTPEDLLFKVRVLPASTATETAVVPGNSLDSSISATGPFRRYDVDFVALPSEFKLTQQTTGRRTGKVSFIVYVFDTDGRLLNAAAETIALNLTPDVYTKFIHSPLQAHMEISVPTRIATYIRVGLQDVPANKFGVVEIPTETISHLAPAVYTPAPTQPSPSSAPAIAPQR
jgi:VWFA-related protein